MCLFCQFSVGAVKKVVDDKTLAFWVQTNGHFYLMRYDKVKVLVRAITTEFIRETANQQLYSKKRLLSGEHKWL